LQSRPPAALAISVGRLLRPSSPRHGEKDARELQVATRAPPQATATYNKLLLVHRYSVSCWSAPGANLPLRPPPRRPRRRPASAPFPPGCPPPAPAVSASFPPSPPRIFTAPVPCRTRFLLDKSSEPPPQAAPAFLARRSISVCERARIICFLIIARGTHKFRCFFLAGMGRGRVNNHCLSCFLLVYIHLHILDRFGSFKLSSLCFWMMGV